MAKILIVDDLDWLPYYIHFKEIMEAGHEMRIATDEDAFWFHLTRNKPDLVILNLRFQSANGWDLLVHIKLTDLNLPVILVACEEQFKTDPRIYLANACFFDRQVPFEALVSQVKSTLAPLSPSFSSANPGY